MICHYWFLNHGYNFQDYEYNGCHDLAMLSVNINDIAIVTVKNVSYLWLFITLGNLKQLLY